MGLTTKRLFSGTTDAEGLRLRLAAHATDDRAAGRSHVAAARSRRNADRATPGVATPRNDARVGSLGPTPAPRPETAQVRRRPADSRSDDGRLS